MVKPKRTGSILDYLLRSGDRTKRYIKKKKTDSRVVSIDPEEEADTRYENNNNNDHDSSTEEEEKEEE